MIKQDDRMKISIAIQDYDKQRAHYHFYNWELAELERCEREIQKVIESYSNNIPDLITLSQEYPRIQQYIRAELKQQMQNHINSQLNSQQSTERVYYSLDGQTFSTIEEALGRNELLQSMMTQSNSR